MARISYWASCHEAQEAHSQIAAAQVKGQQAARLVPRRQGPDGCRQELIAGRGSQVVVDGGKVLGELREHEKGAAQGIDVLGGDGG